MQIKELPFDLPANEWSEDTHPRSEGLHLGTIIADIERTLNPNMASWQGEWAMAGGFIWERVLSREFLGPQLKTGKIVRPGELQVDGIYMTPDGYDTHENVLEEWKCTWKSLNNPIEGPKFWRYWTQTKAYARAMGTDKCRLRVLYLMGDYKGSGPCAKTYEAVFSQKEMDNNWSMIVSHAKTKGWLK
jgi:hypothetical protein